MYIRFSVFLVFLLNLQDAAWASPEWFMTWSSSKSDETEPLKAGNPLAATSHQVSSASHVTSKKARRANCYQPI